MLLIEGFNQTQIERLERGGISILYLCYQSLSYSPEEMDRWISALLAQDGYYSDEKGPRIDYNNGNSN